MCCGCDTSYIVSVHIQCQASIYTLSLCRGHSWRVQLAKQEMLTPPGHRVSPLVYRVRECPPWCSIVGATVTVHQFFCILHFQPPSFFNHITPPPRIFCLPNPPPPLFFLKSHNPPPPCIFRLPYPPPPHTHTLFFFNRIPPPPFHLYFSSPCPPLPRIILPPTPLNNIWRYILFRGNEIVFRGNEIISRAHEIKINLHVSLLCFRSFWICV